jgi:hypothetical protein
MRRSIIAAEREEERKATFCEQKVAKNFVSLGRAGFGAAGPVQRSFCAAFFKKRLLPFWA